MCVLCNAPESEQLETRSKSFDEVLAQIGAGGFRLIGPHCSSFSTDDWSEEELREFRARLGIVPDGL